MDALILRVSDFAPKGRSRLICATTQAWSTNRALDVRLFIGRGRGSVRAAGARSAAST